MREPIAPGIRGAHRTEKAVRTRSSLSRLQRPTTESGLKSGDSGKVRLKSCREQVRE